MVTGFLTAKGRAGASRQTWALPTSAPLKGGGGGEPQAPWTIWLQTRLPVPPLLLAAPSPSPLSHARVALHSCPPQSSLHHYPPSASLLLPSFLSPFQNHCSSNAGVYPELRLPAPRRMKAPCLIHVRHGCIDPPALVQPPCHQSPSCPFTTVSETRESLLVPGLGLWKPGPGRRGIRHSPTCAEVTPVAERWR